MLAEDPRSKRLRLTMLHRGIQSLTVLAQILDLSPSQVRSWFSGGDVVPSEDQWKKIATALDIPFKWATAIDDELAAKWAPTWAHLVPTTVDLPSTWRQQFRESWYSYLAKERDDAGDGAIETAIGEWRMARRTEHGRSSVGFGPYHRSVVFADPLDAFSPTQVESVAAALHMEIPTKDLVTGDEKWSPLEACRPEIESWPGDRNGGSTYTRLTAQLDRAITVFLKHARSQKDQLPEYTIEYLFTRRKEVYRHHFPDDEPLELVAAVRELRRWKKGFAVSDDDQMTLRLDRGRNLRDFFPLLTQGQIYTLEELNLLLTATGTSKAGVRDIIMQMTEIGHLIEMPGDGFYRVAGRNEGGWNMLSKAKSPPPKVNQSIPKNPNGRRLSKGTKKA